MMRGKIPLQWLTEETLLFRQGRQAHDQLLKNKLQKRGKNMGCNGAIMGK